LPSKTLSAIFAMAMTMTMEDPSTRDQLRAFQLAVSHTCQHFLNVASQSPKLWSVTQISATSDLDWLYLCLERSQTCALNIHVKLSKDDTAIHVAHINAVFDLLIRESHRWDSLSIDCGFEHEASPLIRRLCGAHAPQLRHLSLVINNVDTLDKEIARRIRNIDHPQIFQNCSTPDLRFVRLRDAALYGFRPRLDSVVTLHLEQTTTFYLPYSTVRQMITCSLYLTHLSIHGELIDANVSPWPMRTDVVHLPNLLSLQVCGATGELYAGVMLGIDAPSLHSLTIQNILSGDLDPLWNHGDPTRYARLRELVVIHSDLTSATYRRMFETFPQITSFSTPTTPIGTSRLKNILMYRYHIGQEPYVPWPHLKYLTFARDGPMETQLAIAQDISALRLISGCPLTEIFLQVR